MLEKAYQKAYLPFIETLADFPRIKVVLHYTGFLLQWIEKHHPEFIDILSEMVLNKRAEMLSGGFYEPIVPLISERDAVGQIRMLSDHLRDLFGKRPKGMWLAERVWEPSIPPLMNRAGMKYLPIDDYHLKRVGINDDEIVNGYYITEDRGRSVGLFPGSETLRYYIPFKDVEVVRDYLRRIYESHKEPLLTFADDGEKFGIWPSTYKLSYGKGWLRDFFSLLDSSSDWLETTTFEEYYRSKGPSGRVYLPTSSYREMGQWSLPERAAAEYEDVYDYLKDRNEETAKTWIGGGIWRGFFSKYPESNYLHKRMMSVSDKVLKATRKGGRQATLAVDHLYRAQCNDAYWHGIFGGLYLPHLRSALWENLLKAENIADRMLGREEYAVSDDIDCDGNNEIIILRSGRLYSLSSVGGGIIECSMPSSGMNIMDVLSRRREHYHRKLMDQEHDDDSKATATIHERLEIKDKTVIESLYFDDHRRLSFVEHLLSDRTKLDDLIRSEQDKVHDLANSIYDLRIVPDQGVAAVTSGDVGGSKFTVRKEFNFRKQGLFVDYQFSGPDKYLFAIEVNLTLKGSPFSKLMTGKKGKFVKDRGEIIGVSDMHIVDNNADIMVNFTFDRKIDIWHYPVDTVSLSEEGAEKVFQGVCILIFPGNDTTLGVELKVKRA
ncbi:MAG: DUF1926 domain-containing protein [Nitrospirota bacterium]|nr:MAG: DUF1926 domain-containing protein [Nitrospirota bacterium]